MPEFGYPGLPVLSDEERLRRNRLQEGWQRPSTLGLEDAVKQQEAETFARLQQVPLEESTDSLLNAAKDTLAESNVLKGQTYGQVERDIADAPAAREQARQEFRGSPVGGTIHALTDNPVVTAATVGGSFIPHPLAQGASKVLLGLQSAAGMLDPETSVPEKALWATGMLPAMPRRGGPGPGPIRPDFSSNVGRAPRVLSPETPMRIGGALPEVETAALPRYPIRDVPVEGPAKGPFVGVQGPDVGPFVGAHGPEDSWLTAFRNSPMPGLGAGRTFPFTPGASMRGLQGASDTAVDLTGALDDLGGASLSPQEIARARAAERFGRNFRSEGGVPARSVPSMDALEQQTLPPEVLAGRENLKRSAVHPRTGKPVEAGNPQSHLLTDRPIDELREDLAASTIPEEQDFLRRAIEQQEKIQAYYYNKKKGGVRGGGKKK